MYPYQGFFVSRLKKKSFTFIAAKISRHPDKTSKFYVSVEVKIIIIDCRKHQYDLAKRWRLVGNRHVHAMYLRGQFRL